MALGTETKRRPRRRRRNFQRRRRGGLTPAQKGQVKAMITAVEAKQQEKKEWDTELNVSMAIDFSATQTIDLCPVTQGVGPSQRIGEALTPVSLFLRIELFTADTTNRIRVIVWRQTLNSATVNAALTSILDYTTVGNIDRDIYSPYKVHADITKFKVLFDKNYNLTLGTNNQVAIEEMYFDLRKAPQVKYNDTATTGTDHYFISYISDSAAVSHPTLKGWARFRYTDD